VLVIGAEKLSAMVDWQDRDTCFLFGDGAGAVVLRARPASHGLLTTCLGSNGDLVLLMAFDAGLTWGAAIIGW
jgi:3-oxoacyl-[acyl-carrier-protein] synthase-3